MAEKLNYEKLIEDFNKIHMNKYIYPIFEYINLYQKINIECSIHGSFNQQLMLHRQGGGCPKCGYDKKRKPKIKINKVELLREQRTKEFFEIINKKFGDKFDLSKVEYTGTDSDIIIGCPNHGEVKVTAGQFKRSKYGCPYCGGTKNLTQDMFMKLVPQSHKNEYDLSKLIYKTRQENIIIICKIHGEFSLKADNFISGQGCPNCRYIKSANSKRGKIDQIIEKFHKVHNNKYTYREIEKYISRLTTKIEITCPHHGIFIQPIDRHYNGHGCPTCKSSKGELMIIKILEKYNIDYINEYSFKDLKKEDSTKPLRFDFYLPKYNICIEYDGRQHFEEINGRESLDITKFRDNLKNNYCIKNNIKLLRLNYMMENYGKNELITFIKDLGIE